jgi:hypothetical protein
MMHPHHDHPSTHGMLVFGQHQILMSHLPMFHAPHDFQIVLTVRLRAEESDPEALYFEDRAKSGEKVYTWVPDPFVLQELFAPEPRRTMTGVLFRGHFERGGTQLTTSPVTAEVIRVVYARRFTPEAETADAPQYLLVGSQEEQFAVHVVTRPPDFDLVIGAQVLAAGISFGGDAPVFTLPGRKNGVDDRLREGEVVDAVMASGHDDTSLELKVGAEVYFETGDLAS